MSMKLGSLSSQFGKRLLGGELILKGYNNETIADIAEVHVRTVNRWRQALVKHDGDLCVLVREKGSGRTARLNDEQKRQLKDIILAGAVAAGYPNERWTSKIISDVIKNKFGIELAPRSVRDFLPTLGLSPQMPVVKSHNHDDEAVLEWANRTWKRLKKSEEARHPHNFLGRDGIFAFADSR
jgi:transposase